MLLLLAAGGAACGMRAVVWVRGVRAVRAVYDGWCNYCDSRSCCGAADEGSGPRFAPLLCAVAGVWVGSGGGRLRGKLKPLRRSVNRSPLAHSHRVLTILLFFLHSI